jgi:thiosulfate/3-mercaptopyruvate sulfurtransferase
VSAPAASTPVVDAASLAQELSGARPPVLLDVRWRLGGPPGIDSYLAGHLPGAVFVDLDRDLSGPPGPAGRHPLPAAGDFQAAMRRAGVSNGRPVVAYDDGDALPAARAWWLLRYFGHGHGGDGHGGDGHGGDGHGGDGHGGDGHGGVRVLDGGFRAWQAAGQPVTTAEASVTPGDFTADPGHLPVLDAAGAAAVARSGILLDVRAAQRYRGETEPVDPVAGHIPGAVNAPATANVAADGRYLSPGELRERFGALGVQPGQPAGAYCGSGVTAAQAVLALELAGIPAGLYVGSWSNWVADPSRPVATGPTPG